MGWKRKAAVVGGAGVLVALSAGVGVMAGRDWGLHVQDDLASHSNQLFGFAKPVEASSTASADPTAAKADPTLLVTAAKGLHVRTVAEVPGAPNLDQMAMWPDDNAPSFVIGCNEQGTA